MKKANREKDYHHSIKIIFMQKISVINKTLKTFFDL